MAHGFFFILAPWVFIALVRQLGPVSFRVPPNDLIFFLLAYLSFACFGYLAGAYHGKAADFRPKVRGIANAKVSEVIFRALFLASAVYVVALCWDFFITKGGSISTITQIREEDNIAGARMSAIGGVIALVAAAPFILFAYIAHHRDAMSRRVVFLSYGIAYLGMATGFLTGGRNGFAIGLAFIFFAKRINSSPAAGVKRPALSSIRKLGLVLVVLGIFYSIYLFVEREAGDLLQMRDILPIFSLKWGVSVYQPDFDSSFLDGIYAAGAILLFYIAHPLDYLADYFAGAAFINMLGSYSFPIPVKAVDVLIGTAYSTRAAYELLVPGVYLTLPGSLYIDFGLAISLAISFLLHFLLGYGMQALRAGGVLLSFCLSFVLVTVVLSPLYAVFALGNGFSFSLILALLFFYQWRTTTSSVRISN